jgi:O-antigen/teichoic acid export membrane protein
MSLKIQAARGLKWQTIEIFSRQLLSLVVFTTLARLLQPSAFGLIGLVGVYLAFVGIFIDQGIGTALIQRQELEPNHINTAFWFNLCCAVILCLGTVALAAPVAMLFREPRLVPLLRWSSLSLVIGASSEIHGTLFVREMDFRRPALRTILSNATGGLAGLVLAWLGFGVWALVGQQLTTAFAGAIFLWTASSWRPRFHFSVQHLKDLLGISSAVFLPSLLWFFCSQFDQLVIGRFSGAAVLGQYTVGGKVPYMMRIAVQQPVAAVSMPILSRLQQEKERMCQVIYKGMELNAVAAFAVFVGLASVARDLVTLAFGAKWHLAIGFVQLLALYNLVLSLLVFAHPALLSSGGRRSYIFANSALAAGAAAACFLGIRIGPHAVVIGLIVNLAVIGFAELLLLKRRMGLSPLRYCRPCLGPAAAATVMSATVLAFRTVAGSHLPLAISLAFQIVLGAISYLAMLKLTAPRSVSSLWNFASAALIRQSPHPADGQQEVV